MLFYIITIASTIFLTSSINVKDESKTLFSTIKVVQEPANYNYQVNNIPSVEKDQLISNTKPSNFSGPYFLESLNGQCFNKSNERYRFEFCPFANVTQHEIALLWNAFKGIIGIWKEWKIENNTFSAMVYKNGDFCGDIPREATVFFQCGETNNVLNVLEHSKCRYKIDFSTPLVCFPDAMLVYPNLHIELQNKWDLLESERQAQLITETGYKKWLTDLFIEAGLQVSLENKQIQRKISNDIVSNNKTETEINESFENVEQCNSAYDGLKNEIKKLKKQVELLKKLQNV